MIPRVTAAGSADPREQSANGSSGRPAHHVKHEAHGPPVQLSRGPGAGRDRPRSAGVGCDVACVDEGMGLSLEVVAAVPDVARLVASIVRAWSEPEGTVALEVTKEVRP